MPNIWDVRKIPILNWRALWFQPGWMQKNRWEVDFRPKNGSVKYPLVICYIAIEHGHL